MGLSIKTAVTVSVLAALWLLETWLPFYIQFRDGRSQRLRHAARNLTIGLVNALLLALAFGALLAGAATLAERNHFGLLHQVAWPSWAETLLGFVLFDLWMYVWHRANHSIPLLWRFHRMHHSDANMDVTTGVRFHTGEVVLSAVARLAVLPLLGISIGHVAVYEAVFLPVVLFQHSNVRLPRWLDYGLLALIVTPAMHRVHHSRRRSETDSNYGSVFAYWDLLFRSFHLRDAGEIRLGLDGLETPEWQTLAGMLRTPLRSPSKGHQAETRVPARTIRFGLAIALAAAIAGYAVLRWWRTSAPSSGIGAESEPRSTPAPEPSDPDRTASRCRGLSVPYRRPPACAPLDRLGCQPPLTLSPNALWRPGPAPENRHLPHDWWFFRPADHGRLRVGPPLAPARPDRDPTSARHHVRPPLANAWCVAEDVDQPEGDRGILPRRAARSPGQMVSR